MYEVIMYCRSECILIYWGDVYQYDIRVTYSTSPSTLATVSIDNFLGLYRDGIHLSQEAES
ncbi:hypothetical protein J6590_033979 [Homalodisca vitripennis]|nr:hypothetical protein J6590_033979 [Homalodisca vitripennis]